MNLKNKHVEIIDGSVAVVKNTTNSDKEVKSKKQTTNKNKQKTNKKDS